MPAIFQQYLYLAGLPAIFFSKKKEKKDVFCKKKEKKDKIFAKKRKKRSLHRKFANFLSISGLIFPFKLSKLNENCEAVERGRGRSHPQQQKIQTARRRRKFLKLVLQKALEGLIIVHFQKKSGKKKSTSCEILKKKEFLGKSSKKRRKKGKKGWSRKKRKKRKKRRCWEPCL